MIELTNLSNYIDANDMFENNAQNLKAFLDKHELDGIEIMLCDKWDKTFHKKEFIKGAHLWFWNDWIDFWHNSLDVLIKQYGTIDNVKNIYGTLDKYEWLEVLIDNIKNSQETGAKYFVFHVSNARLSETYNRLFHFSDEKVIENSIELLNLLVQHIPKETELLFENLWWPGMTLQNPAVIKMLFDNVKHENCGIMVDTGHLMNTNLELKTQDEAIDFVVQTIENLGSYKNKIRGLHLHYSLSGEFVKKNITTPLSDFYNAYQYTSNVDKHLPFTTPKVKKIIDCVKPQYLVHEFIGSSLPQLSEKVITQKNLIK